MLLCDLNLKKGNKFKYRYDFGDDWDHTIRVLSTDYTKLTPGLTVECYDGERACPPEDRGGPRGYGRMLDILADPRP
jgi:hypothetical protein